MVSLSTEPVSATTRTRTWWSTKTAGWNPRPFPDAPEVADTPEDRLRQMKELASRFSASRYFRDPEKPITMSLLDEPILRYGPSSGDTVDGAMFVFVVPVRNPEILLTIETEWDAQGSASWKYNVSPLSSDGLVLRYDGRDVWNREVINWLSTKVGDPYRIHLVSAREEIRLSEAEKNQ